MIATEEKLLSHCRQDPLRILRTFPRKRDDPSLSTCGEDIRREEKAHYVSPEPVDVHKVGYSVCPFISGITRMSVEDIVTIKIRRENMECEFCNRLSKIELDIAIQGCRSHVLLCGECPASKQVMQGTKNDYNHQRKKETIQ